MFYQSLNTLRCIGNDSLFLQNRRLLKSERLKTCDRKLWNSLQEACCQTENVEISKPAFVASQSMQQVSRSVTFSVIIILSQLLIGVLFVTELI